VRERGRERETERERKTERERQRLAKKNYAGFVTTHRRHIFCSDSKPSSDSTTGNRKIFQSLKRAENFQSILLRKMERELTILIRNLCFDFLTFRSVLLLVSRMRRFVQRVSGSSRARARFGRIRV
jgi:hypothetical protein